jgi:hypothetical protein
MHRQKLPSLTGLAIALLACFGFARVALSDGILLAPTAPSGGGSYTGPGDVVVQSGTSPWMYWFSTNRAFRSADRGNRLINVCNAGDAACADWSSDPSTGVIVPVLVGGVNCAVSVCTIKTFYDRSGNGRNATPPTPADRAILAHSGCAAGVTWCAQNPAGGVGTGAVFTIPDQVQPFSQSVVTSCHTGGTGNRLLTASDPKNGGVLACKNLPPHVFFMYSGTEVDSAPIGTDNWYGLQAVYNGASSVLRVNNIDGATANTGSLTMGDGGTSANLGGADSVFYDGKWSEAGAFTGAATGTQRTNLYANQQTFYGLTDPALIQCVNFRRTLGFVTDPANCFADLMSGGVGDYPQATPQGSTVGWMVPGLGGHGAFDSVDQNSGIDPRLAGEHYYVSDVTGGHVDYRIDLPTPGTYKINLASGDPASGAGPCKIDIYDDTTLRQNIITGGSFGAGQWFDATGTLRTSAAAWVTANPLGGGGAGQISLVFSSTIFTVRLTGNSGDGCVIAHVLVKS